ncbi:sigma 54-interacting transcriptional regulator [Archangium sp.]|uniref:sigma 54-interacting transcriptional regulator n=1 Tax=Archangium sp. TaxID=1872627 RepID=UPI002D709324|nr:sigma 54-interacting transcriptional regulator [Archangium sp.]HYO53508.1 sigma 54-interacting transcriptional regulator [Archangium sp.]
MKERERTDPIDREPKGLKLRSHKISIEVIKGPDAGRSIELPGLAVRIGSSRDCDFVLTDTTVSRLHLHLRIERDSLRVIDAGSRNGTRIDGTEIRDAYARPDSLIIIGCTTLRLRMLADVVELPISARDSFGHLLGQSIAMRRVFSLLERVAPTESTVLIEGETGTGKELVAAGIHEASARADGPFVVFDCSAAAPTLLEGALFGHVKGAFTGAMSDSPGVFEEAHGGTLFLDEIGELPLELQPKLLRAIEAREVRRLGGRGPRRIDVRIVAATNRSLLQEVDRGRFREDLYFRLAVITVRMPPLRERLEDIPLLARHFEKELAARLQPPPQPLPDDVVESFCEHSWPGNVRELRNAVDRALVLGSTQPREEQAPRLRAPGVLGVSLEEPLLVGRQRIIEAYEKEYIKQALHETGGKVTRAAALAGVGRKFMQQAMKRYGLREGSED